MDLIYIGVSLAFAVLHLLLFAFSRREQGNLFFALFAIGFAGMTWGTYQINASLAGAAIDSQLRWTYTSGILQAFALQRFAHLVFLERSPRVYWAILVWGAGVVTWVWLVSPEGLRIEPVMYLALATTLELLRTVVVAASRPQRSGAWLIYLGLAALAVAGALQSVISLGFIEQGRLPTYASGVMLFLFSVSAYLSLRFATTARELELQLLEVRRLSAVTLQQEREARQREVERLLLEAENERKGQELEEARRLQLSMLPAELPRVPGLDIAFQMLTATEVGGDYYDFRIDDGGTLTLAIGDATGHGLNAGLMVASTKSLFQGLDDDFELGDALETIDRGLRGMNLRRLAMSLSLARWSQGVLRVASAGMPPALILRGSSGVVEECLVSAPPLGTLRQLAFEERRLELAAGDVALFATDGLAELLNPDDRQLGYPALYEAFCKVPTESAEKTVAALLDHARHWAGGRPLADDLSLVVMRVARD